MIISAGIFSISFYRLSGSLLLAFLVPEPCWQASGCAWPAQTQSWVTYFPQRAKPLDGRRDLACTPGYASFAGG